MATRRHMPDLQVSYVGEDAKGRYYHANSLTTAAIFAVEFGGKMEQDDNGYTVTITENIYFSPREKAMMYNFLLNQFS